MWRSLGQLNSKRASVAQQPQQRPSVHMLLQVCLKLNNDDAPSLNLLICHSCHNLNRAILSTKELIMAMAHEASRGNINMQVCAISGCNLISFSTSSCSVNVLHYYKCYARQGNRQRFCDYAALWLQQNIHLRSTNNRNVAGRSSETISSDPLLICPAPSSTSNFEARAAPGPQIPS